MKVLDHYNERHCSSGHLYLTRIPGVHVEGRNEIINKMAARGIACNVHYKPLPLHTRLTDEEAAYVIENYVDILKEYL